MKSEASSSTGSRRVCRAAATSACGSSPSPRSRWPPPHSRWAPRAAVVAFVRRDLGAPLVRRTPRDARPTVRPAGNPLLRVPVLAILDQQRVSLVAWTAVVAALGLFFLSFTRTLVDAMLATPSFRVYMERAGIATYTAFIGLSWVSALVLLVSLYAIVQANGWAADDQEGRRESFAAQPIARARVVVERLAALLIGAAVIVAASSLALLIGAASADISLEVGRVVVGAALTLLVAFAFGGLGAAGVGWRPRRSEERRVGKGGWARG